LHLVRNERLKLLASAISNSAVATFVTAIVAPIAGWLYGVPSVVSGEGWPLIGGAWLLLAVVLHVVAQIILGRLRE
jgi:hypothetical protein